MTKYLFFSLFIISNNDQKIIANEQDGVENSTTINYTRTIINWLIQSNLFILQINSLAPHLWISSLRDLQTLLP